MHRPVTGCLWVACALVLGASRADADIWAWGCQGQLSNQQIIFNRSSKYLVDGKKLFGDVHKLKNDNIDAPVTGDGIAFEPQ